MKSLGYLMITAGFLFGSLAAVQTDANEVKLSWYLIGLAVGVAGVFAARLGAHREASHAETIQTGFETLRTSLDRVVERLSDLERRKTEFDPYEVHELLDELFPKDLATFADGRESISRLYGLSAYADVMNEFAAGERYLNRVWSASIDGYVDEVREYLGRAAEQFRSAKDKLSALAAQSAPSGG